MKYQKEAQIEGVEKKVEALTEEGIKSWKKKENGKLSRVQEEEKR